MRENVTLSILEGCFDHLIGYALINIYEIMNRFFLMLHTEMTLKNLEFSGFFLVFLNF